MPAAGPPEPGPPLFAGHLAGYYATVLLDLGRRTGALQAALDAVEGATAAELAGRCGLDVRNLAEWIAGMAAAGYLEPIRDRGGQFHGRFRPTGAALAAFRGGLAVDADAVLEFSRRVSGLLPEVAAAMRTGGGVPRERYADLAGDLIDRVRVPLYERALIDDWLGRVPGVTPALAGGLAVAELGCGSGQACRILGRSFPRSTVTGIDRDGATFERGRKEIAAAGIGNVELVEADAEGAPAGAPPTVPGSRFDLVLVLDSLHHAGRPAAMLREAARLCRPGGRIVVVEPTVAGEGAEGADPVAVLGYAGSLLYCLQESLAAGGPGYGGGVPAAELVRLLSSAGLRPEPARDSPSGYTVVAAGR
jgi:SAM-dependent methyltransferase